jgi:predicted 3-demethylubiquinone-9 3-methyltransferase (glyoxalase superfamily)
MGQVDYDWLCKKIRWLKQTWGVSYSVIARSIGVSHSALNHFINGKHTAIGEAKTEQLKRRVNEWFID